MACEGTNRDIVARCMWGSDSFVFYVDADGVPTECLGSFDIPVDEVKLSSYTCRVCGDWFDSVMWWEVLDHWLEKTPDQAKCPHNDYDDYFDRCGDCGLTLDQ